ncbi:MAG: apolipoprotein N-acyltransferase [Armatimonadetes bacterium]|nr:apolipoprotein N-acyltransferase [Armatimonadota bacterium]
MTGEGDTSAGDMAARALTTSRPVWWLPMLLATIAGGLMFAAFPPADVGELAWASLALFLFALTQCPVPWWGAVAGGLFGLAFYGPLLWYVSAFGFVPWLVLIVAEASFTAAVGFLAVQLNALRQPLLRVAATASLWVLFEYLREHRGSVSLSLGDVYYTQWSQPAVLQLASLGGGHLITFVMVLLSAALAVVAVAWLPVRLYRPAAADPNFRRFSARALVLCYVIFFACYFWGNWVWQRGTKAVDQVIASQGFDIGYVQAAVPMGHTATAGETQTAVQAYLHLTDTLPAGLDMIVWPETAITAVLEQSKEYLTEVSWVPREKGSWLLAGANEEAPAGKLYNTLFLFNPEGHIVDRYRKVHLVLFGEYVPWRDKLKFLERFPIRPYDYAPGEGFKVLQAGEMKFGTLICFESLFPSYTRQLCRDGAEFLVIATSDHWAQGTYEIAQHSRVAILRAVEARRFVVRSATDGESMVITPFGRRLSVIDIGEAGVQRERIVSLHALSTYHRFGDAPLLLLCCALWVGALAGSLRDKKKEAAA